MSNKGLRLVKALNLSRRQAERAVLNGRVKVNGTLINNPALSVFQDDKIELDNETLTHPDLLPHVYFKLWKPAGVECKVNNHMNNPKYKNLWTPERYAQFNNHPEISKRRVFSIGRLDKETSGILLFTSNSQLAEDLMRGECEKKYLVALKYKLSQYNMMKLEKGVKIHTVIKRNNESIKSFRELTKPAIVKPSSYLIEEEEFSIDHIIPKKYSQYGIKASHWPSMITNNNYNNNNIDDDNMIYNNLNLKNITPYPYQIHITLKQGRKRQIHKMLEEVKGKIIALHREEFAGVTLRGVEPAPGLWAFLENYEIDLLLQAQEKIRSMRED